MEWPCFYTRFYRNQLFIGVMLKSCSKNQNSHPTKHLSLFGLQVYRNGLQHGCFSETFVRNYHTSFWQNSSVNYFRFTDIECSKQWIFDKKWKSSIKSFNLVTDGGLYDQKAFCKMKIYFYLLLKTQKTQLQHFHFIGGKSYDSGA